MILSADEVNFTKLGIDLYNMSHPMNAVLRKVLQISEDDNGTQETTDDFFSVEIIAAFAIAVLLSVIVIVIISILIMKRCDTTNEHIWLISQVVISG